MINNRMKTFAVYQELKNGTKLKSDWECIDNIEVTISFLTFNNVSNDIRFKEVTHIGLTHYKKLDNVEKYKLVNEDKEYIVTHVNNDTRMAQLYLKEVVINE